MQKKLLLSIDEQVYLGLQRVVGRGKISHFIEELIRPLVTGDALDDAYKTMAADRRREKEALEWSNAMIGDVKNETR
jgi:hypothetical protein